MYDHEKNVITAITIGMPGWIRPPRQPVRGAARRDDPDRDQQLRDREHHVGRAREPVSTKPPKKPAIRPMTRPIRTASAEATTPTISDVRAPYIVRTNRSRPAESAPKKNPLVRALRDAEVVGHLGLEGLVLPVSGHLRGERPAEDRGQHEEEDDDEAGDRRLVLSEALPEETARRLALDLDELDRCWGDSHERDNSSREPTPSREPRAPGDDAAGPVPSIKGLDGAKAAWLSGRYPRRGRC